MGYFISHGPGTLQQTTVKHSINFVTVRKVDILRKCSVSARRRRAHVSVVDRRLQEVHHTGKFFTRGGCTDACAFPGHINPQSLQRNKAPMSLCTRPPLSKPP